MIHCQGINSGVLGFFKNTLVFRLTAGEMIYSMAHRICGVRSRRACVIRQSLWIKGLKGLKVKNNCNTSLLAESKEKLKTDEYK